MKRGSIKRRGLLYFTSAIVVSFILLFWNEDEKISIDYFIKDGVFYNSVNSEMFTGKVSDTLNGRVIKYEVLNGKKNGVFFLYYPNGNIEMTGLIADNKNEKKWKYFFMDGKLESEGYFQNDIVTGEWKWYYSSGKLKEIANFNNGKREGETIIYDEKGSVKRKMIFREGEIVNEVKTEDSHFI